MPEIDWFDYDGSEPDVVATCASCDGEVYEGDDVVLTTEGDIVHEECFAAFARDTYRNVSGTIDANGRII
ncbi:hypothetical protein [Paenibacillus larvae]|uniref:Uncharacterized protein n=1 Tax=Paenibacillus larvae subsp. larvae DSM 25430 TaxID=697284 RepID=V9W8K2_9BACL|nr:hypothetical protein ERIC2_c26960 [Paenibacillus larvae subsp. larvae DSM 25430]AVG13033.1 hypothetical protein ERICII_02679 [Paenibacillus larvae subsp. larvae DSM 25430]